MRKLIVYLHQDVDGLWHWRLLQRNNVLMESPQGSPFDTRALAKEHFLTCKNLMSIHSPNFIEAEPPS